MNAFSIFGDTKIDLKKLQQIEIEVITIVFQKTKIKERIFISETLFSITNCNNSGQVEAFRLKTRLLSQLIE